MRRDIISCWRWRYRTLQRLLFTERRNNEMRTAELVSEWQRRLHCQQQKSFRTEQNLLMQVCKLKAERKSLQGQLGSFVYKLTKYNSNSLDGDTILITRRPTEHIFHRVLLQGLNNCFSSLGHRWCLGIANVHLPSLAFVCITSVHLHH